MMKAGWVSRPELLRMILGHRPKTFRTPATGFLFRKKWVEIEKDVDIRTFDSRGC